MHRLQTVFFKNRPVIIGSYAIVGPKEGKGNFGPYFDYVMKDDSFGEKSYERAEKKMIHSAIVGAIQDAGCKASEINILLAGDLLNQIISSSYAARSFDFPFFGMFGACSTMSECIAVGASLINGHEFDKVVCSTGSHFSTAERQFRFPLELGNQRPPTSQWTVTGAGACVIAKEGKGPSVTMATFGKVIDWGINDVNNMGGAMAPAAMDTMLAHFKDTNTTPDDYDLIVTGDLGKLGSEILIDLMEDNGIKLGLNYNDCGQMYFTRNQNTLCGGSGCGCSATILNSFIMHKLKNGDYQKVLFMPTGALMSTTATQQGETIPGICHAIVLESNVKPTKKTKTLAVDQSFKNLERSNLGNDINADKPTKNKEKASSKDKAKSKVANKKVDTKSTKQDK